MKKTNLRKCSICNEYINITINDYLKENRFKHVNCYRKQQLNKGLSEEIVDQKINMIKEEMKLEQQKQNEIEIEKQRKKLSSKKNRILDDEYKREFIKWIQQNYNITSLDKLFFIKLANINNGTYKGLSEGITCEDLLYMFKTKKQQLDKIAFDKERHGKGFKDNKNRLYFDIAVIVNKYDSYKEWKEKQKLLELEKENIKKQDVNKIDYNKISKTYRINNNVDDALDIGKLLDEVY